ncbi:peptidoglycan DD-metalloendopeptidase family protein, partial [Candidatus Peregrinibacteria bacterium]|nr:peptidoglycan DD-metalloendopeptidase family protein [Candidatus Peregrinibacteria bacterium]
DHCLSKYEQVEIKEVALEYQKSLLTDYIRVIYEEENALLAFDDNGDVDAFKMLLADGTVGDNLRQLEYFDLLNEAGQQLVVKLEDLSKDLKSYDKRLSSKLSDLTMFQEEIEAEKEQLEMQKISKENLLKLTGGQEDIYTELLEQSMKEQEELVMDIKKLDDAIQFILEKIEEEGVNFNPDDYMDLLDYKTQVLYDFRLNHDGSGYDFSWPVTPERGISAYFRDPGYAGTFGVRHNAVDLPVYQSSPVRAAAHGVVYTTADNGYGYSYIILAHANGFMTVYGHISDIIVEEGDTVPQGSIIGLSGGMPGTPGSGYMTTGPHLHFEMLKNGFHIDPLDYLSLNVFEEEDIEWLPEKYLEKWKDDSNFVPVSRF